MSQLIHLKQRIKAISAIKKITQTMRLISMSAHSKLKKQSETMQLLKDEIEPLLCALTQKYSVTANEIKPKYKTLYILFAAEKGLCGTFNTTMFGYFNQHLTTENLENSHIISVGKKTTEYLQKRNIETLATFEKVLPNRLEKVAQDIYTKVADIKDNYQEVVCFYSYPKTFFVQEAESTTIIPTQQTDCGSTNNIILDDYEWPQDASSVTESLFETLLKLNILLILTNSMLSEQSARFLSMDNATRSADNLQKSMKLAFNKMRQAKITRELIELIASF
ncbi:MAG: hypothetical protein CL947_02285 [Epsilonproteobacteria bacterium]|nr:hypothetical protein [Campylobacterota bacterium]|tara:strand:- start:636 stop:1472 length:837 start_codon:yes stop_codon:yes gene_type:complete